MNTKSVVETCILSALPMEVRTRGGVCLCTEIRPDYMHAKKRLLLVPLHAPLLIIHSSTPSPRVHVSPSMLPVEVDRVDNRGKTWQENVSSSPLLITSRLIPKYPSALIISTYTSNSSIPPAIKWLLSSKAPDTFPPPHLYLAFT